MSTLYFTSSTVGQTFILAVDILRWLFAEHTLASSTMYLPNILDQQLPTDYVQLSCLKCHLSADWSDRPVVSVIAFTCKHKKKPRLT